MSEDVLVVGGGIEGYSAALSALDADPGASVRLLRLPADRFATETGLLDVLGFEPGGTEPVANPLSAVDRLPESHPYSRLGLDTVRDALALFDDVAGERYVGSGTETNALFPTAVGEVAPALRYPRSVSNGVVSGPPSMRLVGFEGFPDFDAELAAERLDERTPLDVTGQMIDTPLSADSPAEMARLLDENEISDGQPARERLVDALEPVVDVEPRIGLPAALGESETAAITETIAEKLRVSVFEVSLGPPSLPGRRLESLLAETLESRGGELDSAGRITEVERTEGRIERVSTGRESYEADSYVLATGGAESGGLVGGPEDLREPVFDCPVTLPDRGLVDERFLGDHPAVRAGVPTDDRLRPVTSDESAVAENLYAAGRVLAGPNVVADHAAGGVGLATGYEAGRRASERS
ncbi:glycerol-3-phosphate dehydrogenase subunit GlpB [Halovenus sp. WSH3]|uniref:Glycerol-3-phosphate dehydrogenase subunit GlpB n=1 Tax=Halovenus carboxidivorans TaxID=2692199 RepID=A0A6B0T8Q8_9EURY|nr:glycerol-3-phosphate dehydrogenase subunit GlpB [Halovenus carboxidivorans]MXR51953.1 glycerol-3-phosphate dehydrogenase subunit GlpB [Halovenus carboxidivorans]